MSDDDESEDSHEPGLEENLSEGENMDTKYAREDPEPDQ